jgi:hypothetical protein
MDRSKKRVLSQDKYLFSLTVSICLLQSDYDGFRWSENSHKNWKMMIALKSVAGVLSLAAISLTSYYKF